MVDVTWRAVGFDLDGTLLDHEGAAMDAVSRFTRDLDRAPTKERIALWFELEARWFEEWRAGRMSFEEQRRRRLSAYLGALDATSPDLDAAFEQYLAHYRAAWRAASEAVPLLTTLRERGIRIGVLTNGRLSQQTDKLDVTGLTPLIVVVCASEEIGVAKPDRRAFEIFLERLGCRAHEVAFIGDNPDADIAGARATGIAAGLVRHGALADSLTSAER